MNKLVRQMLRRVLPCMKGVERMADLYIQAGLEPIECLIQRQQLNYIGKVMTRPERRLEKRLFFGTVERPGGGEYVLRRGRQA